MEKLGQLDQDARTTGRWDLIVVDTPPSRSALDFLDAPERLSSFLDGRFMKLLLAPARGPARLMTAGFGMVTNAITKIIGAQVLQDMKAFVAAFDTLFGGFRQRAQRTFELLQDRRTAFLVIAAPEPDALREAAYFVERLRQERMPLAGLVVNRASTDPEGDLSAHAAMTGVEKLRSLGEAHGLAAGLLRLHADRKVVVEREKKLTRRFATSHPDVPTAVLPALSTDVHDLDGLRRIGELLGAQVDHRPAAEPYPKARAADAPRAQGQAVAMVFAVSCSDFAVSSSWRHEVTFGRLRSSARRSRSVRPPHTPHSISLSSASARHSARTGHAPHTALALCCSAPRTNSSSGVAFWHRAAFAHISFQDMSPPKFRSRVNLAARPNTSVFDPSRE